MLNSIDTVVRHNPQTTLNYTHAATLVATPSRIALSMWHYPKGRGKGNGPKRQGSIHYLKQKTYPHRSFGNSTSMSKEVDDHSETKDSQEACVIASP